MNRFDLLLQDLGGLLNHQGPLRFEEDCCAIKIGDVVLNIQRDEPHQRLLISGYFLDLPEVIPQKILEQLLVGNLYWQAGGTICLEPQTRALIMLHAEPIFDLTPQQLLTLLRKIATSVGEGRLKLSEQLKTLDAAQAG